MQPKFFIFVSLEISLDRLCCICFIFFLQMKPDWWLVLIDWFCVLCNWFAEFVVRYDKDEKFVFWALDDQWVIAYLWWKWISYEIDESVRVYTWTEFMDKSTAVIYILSRLNVWFLPLRLFLLIPAFIRDFIYDKIAARRYSWFWKSSTCNLASRAKIQKRLFSVPW